MVFKTRDSNDVKNTENEVKSIDTIEKELGYLIKCTRMKKNLSIEDVCSALKLRLNCLEILENGAFEELDKLTCAIGYVASVSKFLEVQDHELYQKYEDYYCSSENLCSRYSNMA